MGERDTAQTRLLDVETKCSLEKLRWPYAATRSAANPRPRAIYAAIYANMRVRRSQTGCLRQPTEASAA